MHKKLILACMALAGFVAFVVLPAAASASPVLCETTVGGPCDNLPPKAIITYTNVGETLMTNSSGSVLTRCTTAVLEGELTTNSGTEIEGNVTSASFTGSGSENRCTATFGNSIVTPTVTAEGAAHGLPWCIRATSAMEPDEMQIRGGNCSEASRDIRFILDVFGGVECEYQRTTAIPGTFRTDKNVGSEEDAQATITKQKFSRIRGSSLVCPSEGILDMTFKLETKNGTKIFAK